jgi:hypothetical protein
VTVARAMACWFSNSTPACSNTRFLLVASTPTWTLARGRMAARRFMSVPGGQAEVSVRRPVVPGQENHPASARDRTGDYRNPANGVHTGRTRRRRWKAAIAATQQQFHEIGGMRTVPHGSRRASRAAQRPSCGIAQRTKRPRAALHGLCRVARPFSSVAAIPGRQGACRSRGGDPAGDPCGEPPGDRACPSIGRRRHRGLHAPARRRCLSP